MSEVIVHEEGRYKQNGYYAYDICKECKGKGCCAHFGCMYSPTDFIVLNNAKYTHEQQVIILTELLKQGNISIDMCWMKDRIYGPLNPITNQPDIGKISNGDGILYLRARNANRPIIDFQFFLEEEHDYPCASWDPEKGCKFSEEERPYIGRMLKPVAIKSGNVVFHRCESIGEKEIINLWIKYQLLMYDLYINIREFDI